MEKTFVHKFGNDAEAISLNFNSEADAREAFWQKYGNMLLGELKSWTREGWKPAHEVGPSCFVLERFERPYTEGSDDALTDTLKGLSVLLSFGLLALKKTTFVKPSEFRVTMRR